MTKIKDMQELPIRELTKMCYDNNIAVGLLAGGEISGIYPLVDITPTESFDHCNFLEVKRLEADK